MLSLHLLQAALVYVNTIMVSARAGGGRLVGPVDRSRSPCPDPAVWSHVNLYGKLSLDLDRHLDLELQSAA